MHGQSSTSANYIPPNIQLGNVNISTKVHSSSKSLMLKKITFVCTLHMKAIQVVCKVHTNDTHTLVLMLSAFCLTFSFLISRFLKNHTSSVSLIFENLHIYACHIMSQL